MSDTGTTSVPQIDVHAFRRTVVAAASRPHGSPQHHDRQWVLTSLLRLRQLKNFFDFYEFPITGVYFAPMPSEVDQTEPCVAGIQSGSSFVAISDKGVVGIFKQGQWSAVSHIDALTLADFRSYLSGMDSAAPQGFAPTSQLEPQLKSLQRLLLFWPHLVDRAAMLVMVMGPLLLASILPLKNVHLPLFLNAVLCVLPLISVLLWVNRASDPYTRSPFRFLINPRLDALASLWPKAADVEHE